jgi:hypothetical protein
MSGYCARCVGGAVPGDPCSACPNRPQPVGKTWAEDAIEKWLDMEHGDESVMVLREIMQENWRQITKREPRRLFKGTVLLRRYGASDKRRSRVRAAENRMYYRDGIVWPFGVHARPVQSSAQSAVAKRQVPEGGGS